MGSFDEQLAAAKKKGRPTQTVTVSLDGEVSDRLRQLEAEVEIEKQKPQDGRLAKASPLSKLLKQVDDVKAEFADTLVDLKFTRMLGSDWSDLIVTNPPRNDSLADRAVFGYNFHAVTRAAATASGLRVDVDGDHELSEEQWSDLFGLLSGGDHEQIANAVYALNEGDSNRAVELGKAQRASTLASEKKSG